MYFDYLTVLLFACVGLVFVFANLIVASVIRPKRKTETGLETYECGEEAIGDAWIRFDIRYYTVALVYVIFAVEIAFLFPWALVLGDAVRDQGAAAGTGIGVFGLIEGVLFIVILFLGLAYVWAKGDLDWVLTWSSPSYQPPEQRRRVHLPKVSEIENALEAERTAGEGEAADSDGSDKEDEAA
ncbi:MAG: NADH-quinone oxidoreductase subunit A [Planctomycetes bacterium]|nr:NADH-quinone oxidoreductase subunit A [Planctomycetota bacterium]